MLLAHVTSSNKIMYEGDMHINFEHSPTSMFAFHCALSTPSCQLFVIFCLSESTYQSLPTHTSTLSVSLLQKEGR